MNQRISNVLIRMKQIGLTQLAVTDPSSICYLTGKMIRPGERFFCLLLKSSGDHRLFINKLFPCPEDLGIEKVWFGDTDPCIEIFAEYLEHSAPLGVDKNMAAGFLIALMEQSAAVSYVNGSHCVDNARGCKEPDEREKMVRASAVNDRAMALFRELIKPGVTEFQVAEQVRKIYTELGAEGVSFEPIISFGKNAADPHHEPDDTVVQEGDCVLFDVGCRVDGYCSDMTRTFFYRRASEEQRRVYNIVLQANLAAEALMKPGIRFCDPDHAARQIITDAGFGPSFTHRLGHSIGLEVHEPGDVSAVNTNPVEPWRVFSCEPGIYLEGEFGVRIEDLCMITDNGVRILNSYPKELDIIDPEE